MPRVPGPCTTGHKALAQRGQLLRALNSLQAPGIVARIQVNRAPDHKRLLCCCAHSTGARTKVEVSGALPDLSTVCPYGDLRAAPNGPGSPLTALSLSELNLMWKC